MSWSKSYNVICYFTWNCLSARAMHLLLTLIKKTLCNLDKLLLHILNVWRANACYQINRGATTSTTIELSRVYKYSENLCIYTVRRRGLGKFTAQKDRSFCSTNAPIFSTLQSRCQNGPFFNRVHFPSQMRPKCPLFKKKVHVGPVVATSFQY